MAELSPMMKQYFEIKKDYGDTILMFRLGDFYEMFFDDAKTASKELDLVLTGRDCAAFLFTVLTDILLSLSVRGTRLLYVNSLRTLKRLKV